MVFLPCAVAQNRCSEVWAGLRHMNNLAGVVVTIPHKEAAASLCDELDGDAKVLNVCNVARRMANGWFVGRTLDGEGFLAGMHSAGHSLLGKAVLVIGAGGAAAAVAWTLVNSGIARLSVHNRTREKAQQLVGVLQRNRKGVPVSVGDSNLDRFDIVINATSLGMKADDPLPVDLARIRDGALVADLVMQPDETALIRKAAAMTLKTHKGIHMITPQINPLIAYLAGVDTGTIALSPRA